MSHHRLTRKDIKKDEFAEAVGSGFDYLRHHLKTILVAVVGVAVVGIGGAAVYSWLQHQRAESGALLARALKVYQAPIQQEDPKPDDAQSPSFASEGDRQTRAEELFAELAEDYGGTSAGQVAAVYLGRIAYERGDRDAARERWRRFVEESRDNLLAMEVWLNLFSLERERGNSEELIQEIGGMLGAPDAPLPDDVLLFELGLAYEKAGRAAEARDTFERLAEEFPESTYAAEAGQRAGITGGLPAGFPTGFGG